MTFAELVMFVLAIGLLVSALNPFRKWLESRLLAYFLKRENSNQNTFETKYYKKKE